MSDPRNPMHCTLPGFSVHRILQAKILEWVVISFSIHNSSYYCKKCDTEIPNFLVNSIITFNNVHVYIFYNFKTLFYSDAFTKSTCKWFTFREIHGKKFHKHSTVQVSGEYQIMLLNWVTNYRILIKNWLFHQMSSKR